MGFGSFRFGVRVLGFGVRGLGFGVLGFGFWAMRFGSLGFGAFGIWGGVQSFNNLLFTECSAGSSHDHCKSLSPCTIFSSGLPNPAQRLDAKARSTVYGHTYDC